MMTYARESFIGVLIQFLSRLISEGSLAFSLRIDRLVHHNLTEIPFSREDLDVLKTILAEIKIDSIVIAVITYLKAMTSMLSMARVFFESDVVAQLTATVMQLADIAKSSPLNKTNQLIGILEIFTNLVKQRSLLSSLSHR